ncbi:MAG TPA: CdaR family protein [Bryobacteraceae bacterium]|nr:CdaR family protein [Bryobacteraceae bacterium]
MTRLLTENPGWKIGAILIAAALWFAFVGETELATSAPVSVQFKNVPPDLEITSEKLDRLFLRLRGPATRLTPGSLAQIFVVFDLAQIVSAGEHTFNLGPENLQLPAGVNVVRIVPSQVRLTFEKRLAREVPIEVRYAGPPPKGYRVAGQHIWPQKARIIGPQSHIETLQSAQTDAIDLSSTVSNSEFRIPAFVDDPQIRFDGNPPLVSVRVLMEKIPQ